MAAVRHPVGRGAPRVYIAGECAHASAHHGAPSPRCTPQVRLASLQALGLVYEAFDEIKDLTPIRHFTERFETRLLSMFKDVDDSVAVEAIRLVTRLQACHRPECF